MRKILTAAGVIATSALVLTGCSAGGADGTSDSEDSFTIAHVADFSGDWSFYDLPFRDGLKLAADEINADGGILGKQVNLLTIDSHGEQADAARGAEEALDAGAIYLVGTTDSGGWQAQAAVACASDVPISTGDGSSGTLVKNAGDCAHHLIMLNSVQAGATAQYTLENDLKNAYVLGSSDDEYHIELTAHFIDAFEHGGGTVVANEEFRMGAADFNVQVAQIAAANPKPDFIFTSMFSPDTPQFLRQLRAGGVDLPVFSGDGSVDSSVLDAGEPAEGLVATYHAWPSETNEVGEFIKKFDPAADASESPQYIVGGLGYDELFMIKQVIESEGEATSAALLDGLKKLTFDGVTGALTMDPDTRKVNKEVTIVQVVDGKYVFVDNFVPDYVPAD